MSLPSSTVMLYVESDNLAALKTYLGIGEGYGLTQPAARRAIQWLARNEGVILDPVYSAKAMSALIAHIREGRLAGDEPVVFIHTGGNPALFAYADDLGLE